MKLINDDCENALRTLEENSIDTLITDPPYGLSSNPDIEEVMKHWIAGDKYSHNSKGFMGKDWDSFVPNPSIWKECYRVMKPGAIALVFAGTRTVDLMSMSLRFAGFEIRDMIFWCYGCLSEDTECLTSLGWKKYNELTKDDLILEYDKNTQQLNWNNPNEIYVYDYSGEMINLKNRHTDQLLSPNHNVLANVERGHKRKYSNLEFIQASDIKKRWKLKLPVSGNLTDGREYDEEFAYLIGWYLTDASIHTDGNAIFFYQSKPKTLEKLKKCLSKYKHSEYTNKPPKKITHNQSYSFYLSGDIAKFLIKEFPNRKLTWKVLSWNKNARQRLFDGLMDGDGSLPDRNAKNYSGEFYSKDNERRDIFMALCISLNYRCYEGKNSIVVNIDKNSTEIQRKHKVENSNYIGKIWCINTDTGAFVVRRNGKPFITGNSGFPKSMNISKAMQKNGIENYKDWNGYGTALKPALEPILIAQKKLDKNFVNNALKHGVAGFNIDGGRIAYDGELPSKSTAPDLRDVGRKSKEACGIDKLSFGQVTNCERIEYENNTIGRFPANIILDEESAEVLDEQTGILKSGKLTSEQNKSGGFSGTDGIYGTAKQGGVSEYEASIGGASRFFYVAKASTNERNFGLEKFESKKVNDGRTAPNDTAHQRAETERKNIHPTVKPIKLMEYLCTLTKTPTGGVVLDPFMGSGTTGIACIKTDRDFVGIELSKDYYKIAEARINAHKEDKEKDVDLSFLF